MQEKMIEYILERTFYKTWRNGEGLFSKLELFVNPYCNLRCKYCYLQRYSEGLYPPEARKPPREILSNGLRVLRWLKANDFRPEIEIFSGEPLIQPACIELMVRASEVAKQVVVPTNYTFLLSERLTRLVESTLRPNIVLSASFDGKYCEHARPFKHGPELRDDVYYDKCFQFNAKHRFGFHPMVAPQNIENWTENFLWFQENFKKFGIPWTNLYLLEVRNPEWTKSQLRHLDEFLRFLVRWSWKKCQSSNRLFREFLFKGRGFNILSSPFVTIGRGIGCSIQSTLTIRLGDLAIVPCHRTAYKPFILGYFRDGIEITNPELFVAVYSFDRRSLLYCEQCDIRELCSGGCLGAQLESLGDMFTPHPNVCLLEHIKINAILSELNEIGVLSYLTKFIRTEKQKAIEGWIK